jgi:hypothetical protein
MNQQALTRAYWRHQLDAHRTALPVIVLTDRVRIGSFDDGYRNGDVATS